jgi:hypothetical protein
MPTAGCRSIQLLDAILQSARAGRWVGVP